MLRLPVPGRRTAFPAGPAIGAFPVRADRDALPVSVSG